MGRGRSRCPDLKRKGMKREPGKSHFFTHEFDGSGGAVSGVACDGMARESSVTPDLMLAPGQKIALNKGVMSAPAKYPETGFARNSCARALRMESPPGLL